jgi:galactokinase
VCYAAEVQVGDLRDRFRARFGAVPRLFRAPGRVNLIGEHTDYNDGFVLPAAIELATFVGVAPRADRTLRVHSENFDETVTFDLDEASPRARDHWSDYPRGVAVTLERAGHGLRGADLWIDGEVPLGSGLSSSAAVEVATAHALLAASERSLSPVAVAKLCQRAENEFVGTRCGIMDPLIACLGREGHALLLDCRSLDARPVPIPDAVVLVICHTGVRHALASSAYNERRAQCEEGVRALAEIDPAVRALRDVTLTALEESRRRMSPVVYARCHHVVTENQRTLHAASALERGDVVTAGRLLAASHASLRDAYEVSCRELDALVDAAAALPGVLGARMTGGGFGGCTVSLVRPDAVDAFEASVLPAYERATGRKGQLWVTAACAGAGPLE